MGKLREIASQVTLKDAKDKNAWTEAALPITKAFVQEFEVGVRYYKTSNNAAQTATTLLVKVGDQILRQLGWKMPIRLTLFTSKIDASVLSLAPVANGGRVMNKGTPKATNGEVKIPYKSILGLTDQETKITEYEVDGNKLIFRLV